MKISKRSHCHEIAKCEVAHAVRTIPIVLLSAEQLYCAPLVLSQFINTSAPVSENGKSASANERQWLIPEPWNGNLAKARILFIGQNPSVDFEEDFLDVGTSKNMSREEILDFFETRFEKKIKEGTEVKLKNGTYGRSNPFLRFVKEIAESLYENSDQQVQPGIDYALSEAVRCKSANAIGVHHAVNNCASRYLKGTLQLSGARVIVCLGAQARRAFLIATSSELKETDTSIQFGQVFQWHGKKVIFMKHSSAYGHKGKKGMPTGRELAEIRALLR
jgi:uracil-DNA glycosylase